MSPQKPHDTSDTTCDNDWGRTCRELWPDFRDSWCEGCLNLTRVDATWLAALEAAQPVLREAIEVLRLLGTCDDLAQAIRAALLPPTELEP